MRAVLYKLNLINAALPTSTPRRDAERKQVMLIFNQSTGLIRNQGLFDSWAQLMPLKPIQFPAHLNLLADLLEAIELLGVLRAHGFDTINISFRGWSTFNPAPGGIAKVSACQ